MTTTVGDDVEADRSKIVPSLGLLPSFCSARVSRVAVCLILHGWSTCQFWWQRLSRGRMETSEDEFDVCLMAGRRTTTQIQIAVCGEIRIDKGREIFASTHG
jgi:hypothetical protein